MRASQIASILMDVIHIVALAWQNPGNCTPRDAQLGHVECVRALCKVAHAGHRAPNAACIDTSAGMEGILTRLGMEAHIPAFQKVHMPPCKAAVPLHLMLCVSIIIKSETQRPLALYPQSSELLHTSLPWQAPNRI